MKIGSLNIQNHKVAFEPLGSQIRDHSFDNTIQTLNDSDFWVQSKKLKQFKMMSKLHFSPKGPSSSLSNRTAMTRTYHESNPNPQGGKKRYPENNPKVYGYHKKKRIEYYKKK